MYYFAFAIRLIDGCNACRSMWRAVARASVLALARSSSCIWMVLIWRVRSAGLMPSIRSATSESCCASRCLQPLPWGGWLVVDALAATVGGAGVTDRLFGRGEEVQPQRHQRPQPAEQLQLCAGVVAPVEGVFAHHMVVFGLTWAWSGQVPGRGVRRRRVILRGDGSGGQCRRGVLLFGR